MPIVTALSWKLGTETTDFNAEGKIDIHLNSIFVNGVKKKRIADLSARPDHDGLGCVMLYFSGGDCIKAVLHGGSFAGAAFVEDCIEAFERKAGKCKLPPARSLDSFSLSAPLSPPKELPPGKSSAVVGMDEMDSKLEKAPEQEIAATAAPECSEADKVLAASIEECMAQSFEALPDKSAARTFLEDLSKALKKSPASAALLQACNGLDKRVFDREEEHGKDKKALRAEICEAHGRCERSTNGREALEKQLKVVLSKMDGMKSDNSRMENKIRGMTTGSPLGPSVKRARVVK